MERNNILKEIRLLEVKRELSINDHEKMDITFKINDLYERLESEV